MKGGRYVAWARHGTHWTRLGVIEAGQEDHALLIAEGEALAGPPDELRVSMTREMKASDVPSGSVAIFWRMSSAPADERTR